MMNSRDTKNAKGFPKRLLSSFRKGKKTRNVDKAQNEELEASGLLGDENNKNDACDNVEATILLDSPQKDAITKLRDPSVSLTPKRSLRHVLSANDAVLGGISSTSSTPRAPRFELGGTMSASTDSGIDCSVLLSEKSSPELFVAFTRREAERLRQEQALNGSMLETLTEVDRSDSDSEKVNNEDDRVNANDCTSSKEESQVCDQNIVEENDAGQSSIDATVCIVDNVKDRNYSNKESGSSVAKHSGKEEGDYVLLEGENNPASSSQLIDLTEVVKHNKELNDTKGDIRENVTLDRTQMCVDEHEDTNITKGNTSSVEDFYLSYYANRTDESKAEEMNVSNNHASDDTFLFNASHSIIDPIPMSSSCATMHETLPLSLSPSKIFVNENSAFAKCKSLHRSVSEASKGFLHKIRSRHKDVSINNGNQSIVEEKSFVKKSGLSVLKKLGVKKKGHSKKHNHGDQSFKLFNHLDPGNLVMEDEEPLKTSKKTKTRSPVLKEIIDAENSEIMFIDYEKMNDVSVVTKSPVFKEVLSESVRNELESSIQRRHSPVGQESTIEELTDNINRMTSALCSSSADSIACICDCKNKSSETSECCDRKKSTSPVFDKTDSVENQNECDQTKQDRLLRTPSPQVFTGCVEISCTPDVASENNNKSLLLSDALLMNDSIYKINNENSENSHTDLNASRHLSQNNDLHNEYLLDDLSQSEESCDEYSCDCDDSECSCEECTDLDCSNCCNVSPNTGNVDLLSSSSDSEYDGEGSIVHLLGDKNSVKAKEVSRSRSAGLSRSFSSTSNNDSFTLEKSKSEFTESETSPYSVSFNEVVCENGDVMYVENSFSDYQDLCWNDNKKQSPCHFNSPNSPYMRENSFNVSSVQHKSLLQQTLQSNHQRSNQKSSNKSSHRDQPRGAYSPSLYQDINPEHQDLDSSFTNVSFEGSFADASFTVKNKHEESYREYLNTSSHEISFSDKTSVKMSRSSKRSNKRSSASLNSSYVESRSGDRQFFNGSYMDGLSHNGQLGHLNDSRLSYGPLNPVNSLNDSLALNMCKRVPDKYTSSDHNSSVMFYREPAPERKVDPRLNRSLSSIGRSNKNYTKLNRSFHGTSPASSPLDLSMSRPRSPKSGRSSKPDKSWVKRHVGQVYSPAKRVLHKNQGLSENDLCKQILDLYVSDADESGFEVNMEDTFNRSSILNASMDSSRKFDMCSGSNYDNEKSSESEGEPSCLQYGTYVAPRNVIKETNVDDFTTTTVWTCYSGEARTRRLQDAGNTSISIDRRSRLVVDKSNNSLTRRKKQKSKKDNPRNKRDNSVKKMNTSIHEDSYIEDNEELSDRQALSDRTNTVPRLSKQELQSKLNDSTSSQDTEEEDTEEINKEKLDPRRLNEKGFDRLTMMHTVHNGKRKVRCLSMDESQNVVKYYPPPKEASRISWGQTISEMDLYRHSPRRTPVKTRPILTQKENSYPYEDDTPSPIVLTRMRKPKSFAKKYKNWPWS